MCFVIQVVTILASLVTASAVLAPFPHGKSTVYRYYGSVTAGVIEPTPYASQFALEGDLHVTHDDSDTNLNNAFYAVLSNAMTGMHNGVATDYQRKKVLTPIDQAAKAIEQPFLIVYDDNGIFQGVKLLENEPGWSKNMKMAMASMIQLDMPNLMSPTPLKPHTFITKENTIYGDCWIDYDVHAKHKINPQENEFVVTKFLSPKNCSAYDIHSFDSTETETCEITKKEPVNVTSRRVFEIEKQENNIFIKKLVAHGELNYFPWNARSEAHYVLTNTTFVLDRVEGRWGAGRPSTNFKNISLICDVTYQKPTGTYATDAAVDKTQGRRVVKPKILISKMKKMFGEAADYIDENHLEMKEPDWKHGQTINRLLHTMSFMDLNSLEQVYYSIKNSKSAAGVTIKNIFLGMIPLVGTTASSLMVRNLVRERRVTNLQAIELLAKLPSNVKVPTEDLLEKLEDLNNLRAFVSIDVRKAAILCFSTLIYRTFRSLPNEKVPSSNLNKHIQLYFNRLKEDSDDSMKMVYLMALKNIRVGKIHEVLAPIIRGDLQISAEPERMRLMAIWAITKSISTDYHYAHDLLWPVMADKSLPVKIRIAAYEILMHQAHTMTDVLHIYWHMLSESNEHLYHFHHTTLQGIANSVDPCKYHLRDFARKILRFTKVHETIHYPLSAAWIIDSEDEKYNHLDKITVGTVLNEVTGVPEVVTFQHVVSDGHKPVNNFEVRLHIKDPFGIYNLMDVNIFDSCGSVTNANVLSVLQGAAQNVNLSTELIVDLIVINNGNVVLANNYKPGAMLSMLKDVSRYLNIKDTIFINTQHITYDHLYEKQVTSDMGLAVVLENRVPILTSLKFNNVLSKDSDPIAMDLHLSAKIWRHGDYSITVYNPMADVWHAIRRATSTDIAIPLNVNIIYNSETRNLTMAFPNLPATKLSIAGFMAYAKDCVTVNEEDTEALKRSCPTCQNQVVVTSGIAEKKVHQSTFDSEDTGLKLSAAVFDCESKVTRHTLNAEFQRAIFSGLKNDWNQWKVHSILGVRQFLKNLLISPEMGSCGGLLKIEPSIVYPISRIQMSLRSSQENVDHTNPSRHFLHSEKYSVHGTLDVIAAFTNTSARSWDLNVNVDLSPEHLKNSAAVHLTRKTPGEKNLKICIEAQKRYSAVPRDLLKLGVTKEETNSSMSITVGRTIGEKCVTDQTLVTIGVKGELSGDQKNEFTQKVSGGACTADMANPLYVNPLNIVPKTLNCLNEVIKYTTLRKYTIDVAHKKVPQAVTSSILYMENIIRTKLLSNLKYTLKHIDSGKMKINVEYPAQTQNLEVSVIAPGSSYDFINVNPERPRYTGFGPVIQPLWYLPLDNTRFPIDSLQNYITDDLRMCSVYPKTVLTGDGNNVLFDLAEDKWTLISGDHATQRFAIFAKKVGKNLSVKVYREKHEVEIIPRVGNSIEVKADGKALSDQQLESGVILPNIRNWFLKITKYYDHLIVQLDEATQLMVVYGLNHVALGMEIGLEGRVSGLCGQLNGRYLKGIPQGELYTSVNV